MLLVIQRVLTPAGTGINAYLHEHPARGDWVWEVPEDVPDRSPGRRVAEHAPIGGPGRVQSYLDVAVPDGAAEGVLMRVHDLVLAILGVEQHLPLVVKSGPLFVRFYVEASLVEGWHHELHELMEAGGALLRR